MLALIGVWLGLASFGLSLVMLLYRPAFTDATVTAVLYFGSPGAICLAGLVLWAHRKDQSADPGLRAQRLQAWVAIVLAIMAAGIVYGLIILSTKLDPELSLQLRSRRDQVTMTLPSHDRWPVGRRVVPAVEDRPEIGDGLHGDERVAYVARKRMVLGVLDPELAHDLGGVVFAVDLDGLIQVP